MEECWLEMLFPVIGVDGKAIEKSSEILKENSLVKAKGPDIVKNARPIKKMEKDRTAIFGENLTVRID